MNGCISNRALRGGVTSYEEALTAYEQAIQLSTPDVDPQFYHDKGMVLERLAQQAYEQEKQARTHWQPKKQKYLPSFLSIEPSAFTLLHTLSGHTDKVYSVAFSPDGQILASGSRDNSVKLWNVQTRQVLHTLSGHTQFVRSIAFSPDGQILASGSDDRTINLWGML